MKKLLTILVFIACAMSCVLHAFSQRIEAESFSAQKGTQLEDCSEGGKNVAFIDKDDWLEYALPAGAYKISFRLSTIYSGEQFQIRQPNDAVIYTLQVPNTGGWQTWKTVTTPLITVGSKIRIYSNTTGWNINWFELISTNTPPVIDIGKDTTIYFGDCCFQLEATVKDNEGDLVRTKWQFSGQQGEILQPDSLKSPAWFVPGVYGITMTAIDAKGASVSKSKNITVLYDPNREVRKYPLGISGWLIIRANWDIRTVQ